MIKVSQNKLPTPCNGENAKHAASNAPVLMSPLTTPIRVLPMTIDNELIGDIRVSSKHL